MKKILEVNPDIDINQGVLPGQVSGVWIACRILGFVCPLQRGVIGCVCHAVHRQPTGKGGLRVQSPECMSSVELVSRKIWLRDSLSVAMRPACRVNYSLICTDKLPLIPRLTVTQTVRLIAAQPSFHYALRLGRVYRLVALETFDAASASVAENQH